MLNKKVLVFGAGYVGFSLSVVMARAANVTVVDIRPDIIRSINAGRSPIEDLDIDKHLMIGLSSNRLNAQLYSQKLIEEADFVVLALPTSFNPEVAGFDTSALDDVIAKVADIDKSKPIIIKSTIPVGYTQKIIEKFGLSECYYSPEFLREGRATYDNLNPSRIVIGSTSTHAKEFVKILDDASHQRNTKKVFTDNTTAEVIKLAANSYLAARVSYFNELDTLAMIAGLNAVQLIDGVCADPRIGDGYNNPSFGYGGYCLPKDVKQFQRSFLDFKIHAPLIQSIDASNQQRIVEIINFVKSSGAKNIGIYRAQMKQGSDNARDSVNLAVLSQLSAMPTLRVKIFEPKIDLPENLSTFKVNEFETFCDWSDLILANRDAVELREYHYKVLTRDIYNEN